VPDRHLLIASRVDHEHLHVQVPGR
jgi:hypothetical protein